MGEIHSGGEAPQLRFREKRESEEQHRVWPDALLNEYDVAHLTGLSVASVRRWRLHKTGPRYLKISAAVRYRIEDVKSWLDSRPSGGGAQAEA